MIWITITVTFVSGSHSPFHFMFSFSFYVGIPCRLLLRVLNVLDTKQMHVYLCNTDDHFLVQTEVCSETT